MLNEYGQGLDVLTARIKVLVGGCRPPYIRCSVRAVALEGRNVLSVIIAGLRRVKRADKRRYGRYLLVSEVFPLTELVSRVASLADGHISVAGEQMNIKWHPHFEAQYHSSENQFHDWPGWVFALGQSESQHLGQDPLISWRFQPYIDLADAIRDWTGISMSTSGDSRAGRVLLFVPCFAGRFTRLAYDRHSLILETSCARPSMKVSLIAGGDAHVVKKLLKATRKMRVDFKEKPANLRLYLIDSESIAVDFYEETEFWASRSRRILHSTASAPEELTAQIRQGESDQTEFKPYIVRGDKKQGEILEAVIAFANTGGGRLFFGVNNHAEVEGIDAAISRSGKPREKVLAEYTAWLRAYIGENLNRVPEIELAHAQVWGKTILLLTVKEGRAKPYFDFRTKQTFIRRGSNNVRADPETEVKPLLRV